MVKEANFSESGATTRGDRARRGRDHVLGLIGSPASCGSSPRSVMTGFVNALGILPFLARVPNLRNVPWRVDPLVLLALAIRVGFPKLTTVVPAPLVALVLLTTLTIGAGIVVFTVGQGKAAQLTPPGSACLMCRTPCTR